MYDVIYSTVLVHDKTFRDRFFSALSRVHFVAVLDRSVRIAFSVYLDTHHDPHDAVFCSFVLARKRDDILYLAFDKVMFASFCEIGKKDLRKVENIWDGLDAVVTQYNVAFTLVVPYLRYLFRTFLRRLHISLR